MYAVYLRVGKIRLTLKPLVTGITAALALVAFYVLIVSITSKSINHGLELLAQDRYYIIAIATGFGTQLGLYTHIKALARKRSRHATALAASGTGASTASMIACCLHHVADVVPVIAASGIAVFFDNYRYPLMWAGIAVNLLGIYLMLRMLFRSQTTC